MTQGVMKVVACLAVVLGCLAVANAQPFKAASSGSNTVLPLGNALTNDGSGPFNLTLLPTETAEVLAAIAQRGTITDRAIIEFLTNTECLEATFDTYGVFGRGLLNNVTLGGPEPIGVGAAAISATNRPFLEEIALNEQGHVTFTRAAGSAIPCPAADYITGFNTSFALAYGVTLSPGQNASEAIASRFGSPFNPYLNDQTFVISVFTLEETSATGAKGLIGLTSNPVLANAIAGLAIGANQQVTSERRILWDLRNEIVAPFGETVQQVVARISATRDQLDGPQVDDQGLVVTDPRFISPPTGFVNLFSTNVYGLAFARTPGMVINILTCGSPTSKGGFLPNGLNGLITSSAGYNNTDPNLGVGAFPSGNVATQGSANAVGAFLGPIVAASPYDLPLNVSGELGLTQCVNGPLDNGTYFTRGYVGAPACSPFQGIPGAQVALPTGAGGASTGATAGSFTAVPSASGSSSPAAPAASTQATPTPATTTQATTTSQSTTSQATTQATTTPAVSSASAASSSMSSSGAQTPASGGNGGPCPCSLAPGFDATNPYLRQTLLSSGNCPPDVYPGCPSGSFGYGNSGGCGNVGCFNTGTNNIGNYNTGTSNQGEFNSGTGLIGRNQTGTGSFNVASVPGAAAAGR